MCNNTIINNHQQSGGLPSATACDTITSLPPNHDAIQARMDTKSTAASAMMSATNQGSLLEIFLHGLVANQNHDKKEILLVQDNAKTQCRPAPRRSFSSASSSTLPSSSPLSREKKAPVCRWSNDNHHQPRNDADNFSTSTNANEKQEQQTKPPQDTIPLPFRRPPVSPRSDKPAITVETQTSLYDEIPYSCWVSEVDDDDDDDDDEDDDDDNNNNDDDFDYQYDDDDENDEEPQQGNNHCLLHHEQNSDPMGQRLIQMIEKLSVHAALALSRPTAPSRNQTIQAIDKALDCCLALDDEEERESGYDDYDYDDDGDSVVDEIHDHDNQIMGANDDDHDGFEMNLHHPSQPARKLQVQLLLKQANKMVLPKHMKCNTALNPEMQDLINRLSVRAALTITSEDTSMW